MHICLFLTIFKFIFSMFILYIYLVLTFKSMFYIFHIPTCCRWFIFIYAYFPLYSNSYFLHSSFVSTFTSIFYIFHIPTCFRWIMIIIEILGPSGLDFFLVTLRSSFSSMLTLTLDHGELDHGDHDHCDFNHCDVDHGDLDVGDLDHGDLDHG